MYRRHWPLFLVLTALVGAAARSQGPAEIEPNESKAQAAGNGAFVLTAGTANDRVTGTTTGTSTTTPGNASADIFLIRTGALPPGIYDHRLTITSTTAGHTGRIRGLNQDGGIIDAQSNISFQATSTTTSPPRFNRWYGFGRGERLFWQISGGSGTTAAYTATLTTTAVTPAQAGSFLSGPITISTIGQGHATDTEVWVYDSQFRAIPGFGNDDRDGVLQSRLTRNYPPGTYFVAVSNIDLGNDQASPADDDFRSGTVLEFPDAIANTSNAPATPTSAAVNLAFAITDCQGTVATPATKPGAYGIFWATFTVLPNAPAWETNGPGLDMRLDGLDGDAFGPIDVTRCVGSHSTLTITSTNLGMPWDLAIAEAAGVAGPNQCGPGNGGFALPANQVINVALAHPSLTFAFGAAFSNSFDGPLTFNVNAGMPVPVAAGQAVILAPSHADGLELSALTQVHFVPFTPPPTPVNLLGDEEILVVPVGCFPFYGVNHTQIVAETNGRILFGGDESDPAPDVFEATRGFPFVGAWMDLDTDAGSDGVGGGGGPGGPPGAITISQVAPGVLRYDFVGYHFGTNTAVTFRIELDGNTGEIALKGLSGIGVENGALEFLGISAGSPFATDGGPTTFVQGGPFTPPGGSDMIYAFADGLSTSAGQLAPGINEIRFTPVTGGPTGSRYAWTALP